MNNTILENHAVQSARSFLYRHKRTWLPPTIICGGLALIYVLLMSRHWEASQAVVVRQDADASASRPGKFADLYEMRTAQETILELARSQQVVVETLRTVDQMGNIQPSPSDVEEFRHRLKMSPPGGAEFGKTEVFYLSVKDPNRKRALQLVAELCRQLDLRMRALRGNQAQGLVTELQEQLDAAGKVHAVQTARLAEFEAEIGADLGELRLLNSASSGQSDMRQQYVALEADSRRYKEQVRETNQLLQLLKASQEDVTQLAALPNSLLTAQPALRRLKDGLVDAQLVTSRLQGTRSAAHPLVQASVESEASIRRDLVNEMQAAMKAADAELTLSESRYEASQQRLKKVELRLADLAQRRAEYSNRVSAIEASRESLDVVRQQLAAAQASQAAAQSASVLTLVDNPETGPSPNGPSRAMTVLAGILGGFTLGLGLVVYPQLAAPLEDNDLARAPLPESATAEPKQQQHQPEWWETPSPVQDVRPAEDDDQLQEPPPEVLEVEVAAASAAVEPTAPNESPAAIQSEPNPPVERPDATVMLTTPADFASTAATASPAIDESLQEAMRSAFTPSN